MAKLTLRVNDVKLSLKQEKTLRECVAKKLGIRPGAITQCTVLHRAVDARHKDNVCLLYHVAAEVDVPSGFTRKLLGRNGVKPYEKAAPAAPQLGSVP